MAFEKHWFFNITTETFIRSLSDPSAINPPVLVYGDTPTIRITFVRDGSGLGVVEVVDSATSVRVTISSSLTSDGSTEATAATCTGPDSDGVYTCALPLGTSGIQNLIGQTAWIEFKTGAAFTSFQGRVSIRGLASAGTVAPTPPGDAALGEQAAIQRFMLRDQREYPDDSPSVQIIRTQGGRIIRRTWDDSGNQIDEPIS